MNPHTFSGPSPAASSSSAMRQIFRFCRTDDWKSVLKAVREDPSLATSPITMDNNISTTILHQAITSKGDMATRAIVIRQILRATPFAASIKNGYGSLPLHVITQRNTKIKSKIKEELIRDFIFAYREALFAEGGTGKRTPIHIAFTDYISPGLTNLMIDQGPRACFMKDKKGWLPAHVACSRHCSPQKLKMLLAVNPGALYETTENGETLLSLATSTATKSHPNYALIDEINKQLNQVQPNPTTIMPRLSTYQQPMMESSGIHHHYHEEFHHWSTMQRLPLPMATRTVASPAGVVSEDSSDASTRGRFDSGDSFSAWHFDYYHPRRDMDGMTYTRSSRKRKLNEDNASEALLLLSRDQQIRDLLEEDGADMVPSRVVHV